MLRITANSRFLVSLADGISVETVYYESDTLCVSSQAGCAVHCPFCASGSRGWVRNLNEAEMWAQVAHARMAGYAPARITLSGIGEPLHNLNACRIFLERCRDHDLPVSLTTTGGSPTALAEAMGWRHNGLMLSLHAGTPATHRLLVPHAPDLVVLLEIFARTLTGLSRRRRRKFGINYLLLKGINDQPEELTALLPLFREFPELTLHLLVCNAVPDSAFVSPPTEKIDEIHGWLRHLGIRVRRPNPWRNQPEGGCGTLFVRNL